MYLYHLININRKIVWIGRTKLFLQYIISLLDMMWYHAIIILTLLVMDQYMT